MPLQNEGAEDMLQGLLGKTTYLSLHTANPGSTGASELQGNAYARVAVAASDWTITNNTATNKNLLSFPTPTGNWGDPTYLALWDAASAGNLLFTQELARDVDAPVSGAGVTVPAGDLDITLSLS